MVPISNKARALVIEVCVDGVESAVAAQHGGADRVELCDNLIEGGTTPSLGMIEVAREHLAIPLHAIIRPRGGDFCYSDFEMEVMRRDIARAQAAGVDGVVFGVLTPDGAIDIRRTADLVAAARPMSVTFHRAFDMTRDPRQALEDLIGLGIERVLTSGQAVSALEGLALIAELLRQAGQRIVVMPGGGVARDIERIVGQSAVREVHLTATTKVDSLMRFHNPHVAMSSSTQPTEGARLVTDAGRLRRLRHVVETGLTGDDFPVNYSS